MNNNSLFFLIRKRPNAKMLKFKTVQNIRYSSRLKRKLYLRVLSMYIYIYMDWPYRKIMLHTILILAFRLNLELIRLLPFWKFLIKFRNRVLVSNFHTDATIFVCVDSVILPYCPIRRIYTIRRFRMNHSKWIKNELYKHCRII